MKRRFYAPKEKLYAFVAGAQTWTHKCYLALSADPRCGAPEVNLLMRVSLFIGSPFESKDVVEALREKLEDLFRNTGVELEVNPWYHGVFGEGDYTLDSLVTESARADFAVFVGDGIDHGTSRGFDSLLMRDNILFEYGLFMGVLGRSRVFLLQESHSRPKMPSDLLGFTHLPPYARSSSRNLVAALGTPANHLLSAITKQGPRNPRKPSPRVRVAMGPGSTEKIEILADCALYIADDADYRYHDSMKVSALRHGRLPTKYLYYTHEGSQRWLDLCKQPSYAYFHDSAQNIRESAGEIVEAARASARRGEFDFISLGPGDGNKDRELIRHMARRLGDHERLFYYPIDVSETLLVAAVRTVMRHADRRIDVKAILADFTLLKSLNFIYELRDGINFFSIHGNTIGNSSEQESLDALDASMLKGDFLFLEVNINKEATTTDAFFTDEAQLSHGFSPLRNLGINPKRDKVAVWESPDGSVVPGSKTIITDYDASDIPGAECKKIAISEMHYYDLGQLAAFLEERMDLDILLQRANRMSGLILARRRG